MLAAGATAPVTAEKMAGLTVLVRIGATALVTGASAPVAAEVIGPG